MVFTVFIGLPYRPRSSLVKLNKETKEFIQLVIENSNGQVICFSSGPIRAIPRGTRVKNAVGDSPSAFLVPDILLWDPLLLFPALVLLCPSCDEKNTQETLSPIRWKDGGRDYDQPRLLCGLRNDVLLVGRVYLCRNKHQILSHDQGILCQLRADFQPPFLLFHKIGVTRELFQFFTSHISAGMTISDVQVLWHQSLFDEYGVRKMCFLTEKNESKKCLSKWPTTNAELVENKNAFYRRGGFPSVIGCVDGTHIRIQAPYQHENGYVNRKGFHSINVQGICFVKLLNFPLLSL